MALLLFFFFLYSLTLRISLHLSPSRGKCWKGRLQKNQKKQKNKTLKTWTIGEVVSFPFWASDPAFLACPFSYSILCSLPYSWTHHPSCILFFFLISSFEHVIWFHISFFLLFFLSPFPFPESFSPSSSLHRSTRAQRVSSGLLVYVILFFNWEFQWTWSYILISSK